MEKDFGKKGIHREEDHEENLKMRRDQLEAFGVFAGDPGASAFVLGHGMPVAEEEVAGLQV